MKRGAGPAREKNGSGGGATGGISSNNNAPKQIKKSVSFRSDVNGAFANAASSLPDPQDVVPQVKSDLAVLPVHNLLVLGGMFYFGLTNNVEGVMLKGYITSLPLEAIYNYMVITNLKKRSKHDNVPLLILSSILVSLVYAVPLFFIIILLGAPVYGYTTKTILLALHLSQLVIGPLACLYSLDFDRFKILFELEDIYYTIFSHSILSQALLTLGGCWLGVIPIPLDWDRPWQQWPITLLVGAYLGGVVGGLVTMAVRLYARSRTVDASG
ncbi:uncharacterized protein LODBEIA_P51210 [Lodderomyces beijingensis]|uniref:Glycosylphosphatidylinositol anchor biosynthesis protein 11 n=1 Tax=Lodderomyces beijingensis TaxID=1775926 RepID=A0ABP0ZU57_9ASCO